MDIIPLVQEDHCRTGGSVAEGLGYARLTRDVLRLILAVSRVPNCGGVKFHDILYVLSPDIVYTCWHPVKLRQALLESYLTEE